MTTQPSSEHRLEVLQESDAQTGEVSPVFSLTELEKFAARAQHARSAEELSGRLLDHLGIDVVVEPGQDRRIPKSGPVIFLCNQSFGTVESLALLQHVAQRRSDLYAFSNLLLSSFQQLHERAFFLDPGWRLASQVRNVMSLKAAMRAVAEGHAVGPLPTDDSAQFDQQPWQVVDPGWHKNLTSVIMESGATVVPVAFTGNHGALARLSALLESHPGAKDKRELQAERCTLRIEFGTPLRDGDLTGCQSIEQVSALLRDRSRSLRLRARGTQDIEQIDRSAYAPVAPAGPAEEIAQEVAGLPAKQVLVRHKNLKVAFSCGAECPALLDELGRLRQLTFREVGEGTAAPRDLDAFDEIYDHLFVWNEDTQEVVGAYRMGRLDALDGRSPYSATLFDFADELWEKLGPSIELGRSFVRQEYQRSAAGLIMLWKGIGQYVGRAPQYKNLLGPVSISADYSQASQQLMVRFMEDRHGAGELDGLVRPRTPFDPDGQRHQLHQRYGRWFNELGDVNRWVSHLERDGKGVPVLVKSYLQLGGQMLGFNVDKDFGHCVDGLVLVDLTRTKRATLDQFMGKDVAEDFLRCHGACL